MILGPNSALAPIPDETPRMRGVLRWSTLGIVMIWVFFLLCALSCGGMANGAEPSSPDCQAALCLAKAARERQAAQIELPAPGSAVPADKANCKCGENCTTETCKEGCNCETGRTELNVPTAPLCVNCHGSGSRSSATATGCNSFTTGSIQYQAVQVRTGLFGRRTRTIYVPLTSSSPANSNTYPTTTNYGTFTQGGDPIISFGSGSGCANGKCGIRQ